MNSQVHDGSKNPPKALSSSPGADNMDRDNVKAAVQVRIQPPRPDVVQRKTYPHHSDLSSTPVDNHTNNYTGNSAAAAARATLAAPRPCNRSPYSRGHLRSHSSNAAVAPPMTRAHSLPSYHSLGQLSSPPTLSPPFAPSSPRRAPIARSSSPLRSSLEESRPRAASPTYDGGIESISEDAELAITPRAPLSDYNTSNMQQPVPLHAGLNSSRTLAVRRQRPTSPLHSLAVSSHTSTPRSSSGASSPSSSAPSSAARYNEGFPTLHHWASNSSFSSVPSTPSSARSRSPSISSLETIEDAPDLEWKASEADRQARLNALAEAEKNPHAGAAAAAEEEEHAPRRRSSLDMPSPGARGGNGAGAGFGFGRRGDSANRKRWSICGGERRADLDLETIWED